MNRSHLFRALVLSAATCAVALPQVSLAQPKPLTAGINDGSMRGRGEGLAGMTDDALMQELSRRKLSSLLDRAFEVNRVEESKRDEIKTLMALSDLSDPDRTRTARKRQETVRQIVAGIEAALPHINDPRTLMENAAQLIVYGVERDVNTLEYWGENPATQAALRPVAETVVKILTKAAETAAARAEQIGNRISNPNDPAVNQYMEMDELANNAMYTKYMVDYYLVLAMDRSDPERGKIIDEAIEYLSQYDNADSQVQPLVKARIAKLYLQKGDHRIAKQQFDMIANRQTSPAPNIGQQFEARYFSILCDLEIPNFEAVQAGINELTGWYKTNLPNEKSVQDGANAALSMLRYRMNVVASKQQTEEAMKNRFKGMAVQELLDLLKQRPDLQGIIYEQLMGQLPENPEYKTLDPLLLSALVRKADQERIKPDEEQPDMAVIERGIAAARELVSRLGQPGIDPQVADDAALLIGLFLERQDKKLEAGNAFLDYIDQFKGSAKNGEIALNEAMAMVAQLRREGQTDAAFQKLYERFLATAINKPFNKTEFAFEYAQVLQRAGEFESAAKYYALVPTTDNRHTAAEYFRLLALKQQIDNDPEMPGDKRQAILAEIRRLTDSVQAAARQALATAESDKDRMNARSILVRTSLLGAELARTEEKNPERVLKLLEGFDESVQDLPRANDLLAEALQLRVNAYMAVGDNNRATDALVKLLEKTGAREGSEMVYKLLLKLEEDLDKAQAANDTAQVRLIAQNRATLSGFLVSWAKNHRDADIRRFYYRYSVFDAASKHLAADLEESREARRKGREEALKLYEQLLSPEFVKMYQRTLEGTSVDPNYPDPQVILGIGLLQYDLQNYEEAQKHLGKLLYDRKLGTATMTVTRDGEDVVVDNDQYWEATLKLLRSNVEIANKTGDGKLLEDTKNGLKRQFITWGKRTGGKKWHSEFEALRQEIIPDFNYEELLQAEGATQPAG
jgi:hypothetical protein